MEKVVDHPLKHLLWGWGHSVSIALFSGSTLETVDEDERRLVSTFLWRLKLPTHQKVAWIVDWLAVEAQAFGHRRVQEAKCDGDPMLGGQHLVDVRVARLVVIGGVASELKLVVERHIQSVKQLLTLSVIVPV